MKTKEQIQARIDELKKVRAYEDYEIIYLKIALMKDEKEIESLFDKYKLKILKYTYELNEDEEIMKALKWVLEKE